MITKYDFELKQFTVNYQKRIIKEDGVDWVSQDGNVAEMEHVKINMIQYGIELHQRVEGSFKSHNWYKEAISKEALNKQSKILKPDYVYMTDLDEALIVNVEHFWMEQEVLNVSACLISFCIHVL